MIIDTTTWHWPQYTMIGLLIFGIVATSFKHGKPQGPYNVSTSIISFIIMITLLVTGGFFG